MSYVGDEKSHAQTMDAALKVLQGGDEQTLRDLDMPWPKTAKELDAIVQALTAREHDYGTCCYAMSIAAEAAFNYIAHQLGVTGFQASCADMDILRRTRGWKRGFRIVNYENLLYPQYRREFDELGWWSLIHENALALSRAAQEKLAESPDAHPDVRAHWETLAALAQ